MKHKKFIKTSLILCTALTLTAASSFTAIPLEIPQYSITAEAATNESYFKTTENDDGTVTITGLTSSLSGDVVIPETIGGKKVSKIGYGAFRGDAYKYALKITSLTIGDNIEVQAWAFLFMSNLETVSFGNNCSFYVYENAYNPFSSCPSLKSIEFGDNCVISKKVIGYLSSLEKVSFGKGTTLGEEAFYDCDSLRKVTIGDGATINQYAFNGCDGSFEIEIGNDAAVKKYAFRGCNGVTKIVIGDNSTFEIWSFYLCSNLKEAVIGNSARIISQTFRESSIEKVTVGDDAVIDAKAFYDCPSIAELICSGEALIKDNFADKYTPNVKISRSSSRQPLTYDYGEIGYNLIASKEMINCSSSYPVSLSTYGRLPGQNHYFSSDFSLDYGGIWHPDTVQELTDSKGNHYTAYGYYDQYANQQYLEGKAGWCCIQPEDSSKSPVVIKKEGWSFGAAVIDENDHLFIMWGKTIADDKETEALDNEEKNIVVEKYDLNGNTLASNYVSLNKTNALRPLAYGTANLRVKNGILFLSYNTEWTTNQSDGKHHQGIGACLFNQNDLSLLDNWYNEGSHSFGNTALVTSYGVAVLQMGDEYSRSINVNTYRLGSVNDFENDYLGSNAHVAVFHAPGTYEYDGNPTYCQLGNIAESNSTMAFSGSGSHEYTSEPFKFSPVRTKVYDAFIVIKDKTLNSAFSDDIGGENRIDEATGEVVDTNIFWLTDTASEEGFEVGQTKLVTLEDGSYCVLWEEWRNDRFDCLKYTILDEVGNVLRSPSKIFNARLSETSFAPIVEGSVLKWAAADADSNSMIWYSVNLDQEEITPSAEKSAKNASASLTLGGMLGLNFYFTLPSDYVYQGVYAKFSGPEGDKTYSLTSDNNVSDDVYCLTYEITSIQSGKPVSLKLVDADGNDIPILKADGTNYTDNTLSITAKQYLEKIDTSSDTSLNKLVSVLKEYFAYAEKYFNGTAIPEGISKPHEWKADNLSSYAYRTSKNLPDTTKVRNISLVLDSRMDCRLYFECTDGIENHKMRLANVGQKNGMYYLEKTNIDASNLNNIYTIVLDDVNVTFGPYTYVRNVLAAYDGIEEKADLVNLVRAIVDYGQAASAYKDAH